MNVVELEKLFVKYPELPSFMGAGVISHKRACRMLGDPGIPLQGWEVDDLTDQLILIGAVKALKGRAWTATPECIAYLEERRV